MSANIRSSIMGGGIFSDEFCEYRSFKHQSDGTYKILINLKKEILAEKLRSSLSLLVREISPRFRVNNFPQGTFRDGSPYNGGFRIEDDRLRESPERGVKSALYAKEGNLKAIRISPYDPGKAEDMRLIDFIFENILNQLGSK